MTTREPGASEVLTQGLVVSPSSTARLARSPEATITAGFEVLVQLVIAAMTTSPSRSDGVTPDASTVLGALPTAARDASFTPARVTRSCGRDGPASDGSTVARSSE